MGQEAGLEAELQARGQARAVEEIDTSGGARAPLGLSPAAHATHPALTLPPTHPLQTTTRTDTCARARKHASTQPTATQPQPQHTHTPEPPFRRWSQSRPMGRKTLVWSG